MCKYTNKTRTEQHFSSCVLRDLLGFNEAHQQFSYYVLLPSPYDVTGVGVTRGTWEENTSFVKAKLMETFFLISLDLLWLKRKLSFFDYRLLL